MNYSFRFLYNHLCFYIKVMKRSRDSHLNFNRSFKISNRVIKSISPFLSSLDASPTSTNAARQTRTRRPRGQRRVGSHNKAPRGPIRARRKQQITPTNPAAQRASRPNGEQLRVQPGGFSGAVRFRVGGGGAPTLKRLVAEVRAARPPFSSTLLLCGLTAPPNMAPGRLG